MLQELKAEPSQIPEQVKLADYHAYWHGFRAYSGVSLHIRKGRSGAEPASATPIRHGIAHRAGEVGASSSPRCTLPNAARTTRRSSLHDQARGVGEATAPEGRELVLCGA